MDILHHVPELFYVFISWIAPTDRSAIVLSILRKYEIGSVWLFVLTARKKSLNPVNPGNSDSLQSALTFVRTAGYISENTSKPENTASP